MKIKNLFIVLTLIVLLFGCYGCDIELKPKFNKKNSTYKKA